MESTFYFFGFFVAFIIILAIIASPFLVKMLFKMKYYNGLSSGLLCVGLCLLDFLGCFTLCFFIADTYFKIERFTFTFHGLPLIQFKRNLNVKYVYLGFYFFLIF